MPEPKQLSMSTVPMSEYELRVLRAHQLMREQGIDGLVVTDPITFYYFTGQKVPTWQLGRPNCFLLPLEGEPVLISWSGPEMFARVSNRPYPSWVKDRRIYPEVPFSFESTADWGLRGALVDRKLERGVVAIELGQETYMHMPVNDYLRLKRELAAIRWVESGPVVWGCRMIKSSWEIAAAKKACEIGGRSWSRALDKIRPGISTRDLQTMIMTFYFEEGADLDSPPPTVLGAKGPGGTFQKGDVLYLDSGPSYLGYKMDFTRRAVFGPPSPRQLDEHNGMWEILFKVMDRMKPGVTMAEVFEYSQSLMAKRPDWRNYSDHPSKRIGHGIGLENEPPSLNAFDKRPLAEGMALTPEPKIESVDGLVNPEEHIVMTADGWQQLSQTPWQLRVIE
jgi:Xaa-Pro aminopeptidase